MGHQQHTVTVFAPSLHLSVTIERTSAGHDEVHIHPGGQGFWIARMLKHLEERPLLCGPLGGEPGRVFFGMLTQFGMDVSPIEIAHATPTIIQDRRSGDRRIVAESPGIHLVRHESDDLYGRFLDRALASTVCIVTGQPTRILPTDAYRRLGHDLVSAEVKVVADIHGPELWAFLDEGTIDVLKVSDEDLAGDGLLHQDAGDEAAFEIMDRLTEAGAKTIVLSRQSQPALVKAGPDAFVATFPELKPADRRGAGDSMTAGLAAGLRRRLSPSEMFRLGCAAGAANVTRHGLGSADSGLIPGIMRRVDLKPLRRRVVA